MKTIIILAHPNIEHSHINKSWIEALKISNPEIKIHDIYKTYPDWNINAEAEQKLLEQYDRIILEYPIQWYSMTPLLKKWLDDVFLMGWCYGENGNKLKGKEIGVAVSTAGVEEAYTDSDNGFGTLEQLLKPVASTVKFVGGKYISYHTLHGAYQPDVNEKLSENIKQYIRFITQ
ncbi:NAD(P)H-dependent oxidoreductase [uncultured Bacteroides sp.]|uniref:NAD(P)H-dependent oxidoreductase n=1 Tax=uncultured Bacteroides sp. TaxID=162156 RepID=UPI002AAB580F|nr:NAD(P)H-dependent oxidoreductase [uncultured Bacteroides sp.]